MNRQPEPLKNDTSQLEEPPDFLRGLQEEQDEFDQQEAGRSDEEIRASLKKLFG